MPLVSINRIYVVRCLLFAMLLLWPLLMFGRPAYMMDSASYQKGGARAVEFLLQKLNAEPESLPSSATSSTVTMPSVEEETKVARSILYSVTAYLFSGPRLSMEYMAAFQALALALVFTALFEAVAGPSWQGYAAMVAVSAGTTTLAPVATFMVPDSFTAIMLGIMAVLPVYWNRFGWDLRILLLAMGVFSVAAHDSHPPLAMGTALVMTIGFLLLRARRSGRKVIAAPALWLPAVLGLVVVIASGVVGFGKVGVAPKRHTLALARGIENGPTRWYLEDACRDRKAYAICEIYGTAIPRTAYDILWGPNNLVTRATPEQLDRARAEEGTILLRATLRYPVQQAWFVMHDVPLQFVTFKLDFLGYDGVIERDATGDPVLASSKVSVPAFYPRLDAINMIAVLVGAAALARWWRVMTTAERVAVLILAIGLLINAAVCALFSGVAARYQARIIWLIPFLAIAIGVAVLSRRKSEFAALAKDNEMALAPENSDEIVANNSGDAMMKAQDYLKGAAVGALLTLILFAWNPLDKDSPLDHQIIFSNYRYYDNGANEDGWIQINGSLNNPAIPDDDPKQPANGTYTIDCTQANMTCSIANAQQSDDNTVDKISTVNFAITSWEPNKVIASQDAGSPIPCARNIITINRQSKKTSYVTEPMNAEKAPCDLAQIETARLVIGDSRGWRHVMNDKSGWPFDGAGEWILSRFQ